MLTALDKELAAIDKVLGYDPTRDRQDVVLDGLFTTRRETSTGGGVTYSNGNGGTVGTCCAVIQSILTPNSNVPCHPTHLLSDPLSPFLPSPLIPSPIPSYLSPLTQ